MEQGSRDWVSDLTGHGAEREAAVADLHAMLGRVARAEALRRAGQNGLQGRELDDLAVQAASDATMSVLRKIGEFRGDSRFTTWAYKFAIFEVSSKIGRHVWKRDGVRFEPEQWDMLPAHIGLDPVHVTEARQLVAAVRRAVEEELTAHQRRVFVAVALNGTPLDTLVVELGTNRNAVYKTMFDARRKLRSWLVTHGYLEEEVRRDPEGGA